jgi:hypothetical protein
MVERIPGSEATIRREIRRIAWEYGKLGLLADDSEDARVRVARELYGADDLPLWWRVVRSIECLQVVLDEIVNLDVKDEVFGFAVIDRYLLAGCANGRQLPVPWDKGTEASSIYRKIEEIREGNFRVLLVTSFPHDPPLDEIAVTPRSPESASRPLWSLRSLDLLRHERARVVSEGQDCLLRFGPERLAPIAVARNKGKAEGIIPEAGEREQAIWAARTWSLCIDRFAAPHGGRRGNVLLTGAGASIAQGSLGVGTPPPWKLLELALAQTSNAKGALQAGADSEPAPEVCLCGLPVWHGIAKSPDARIEIPDGGTFGGLRETVKRMGTSVLPSLVWDWQKLFDEHVNEDTREFEKFAQAFRLELYRHDHGFAHHHWLFARLPWEAIVTTNFDGFHERAAFAAAQIPWLSEEQRKDYLRFSSAFDPRVSGGRSSSLFKPYGSLLSGSPVLAFGANEIAKAVEPLEGIFKQMTSGSSSLIVVGSSMRDVDLEAKLRWFGEPENQVLWVDPAAYSRAMTDSSSSWCRTIRRRKNALQEALDKSEAGGNLGLYSGPLPGRAIDFACDLWRSYQRFR